MTVFSFIHLIHCDMFRPEIAAIIGQCYDYIKGKKRETTLLCTFKYRFKTLLLYQVME
jgi:hypothetical protein